MVSFIEAHRDAYGVEPICAQLQIAPSTYYEHKAREMDPERLPPRVRRDRELSLDDSGYLFPSRVHDRSHLSTRQYARIVNHHWISSIGLDPYKYGTHSMRRTKAALIYKKTGNLRAVLLLLGHTKLESTVRYLGIEVDDALQISEQIEL
jgi:site-specific recombinase XerD